MLINNFVKYVNAYVMVKPKYILPAYYSSSSYL